MPVAGRGGSTSAPATLTIAHEIADGRTAVELDGPAPVVVAYAPVARLALSRLVHIGS